MPQNRRDFILSSSATILLTVTKASAQGAGTPEAPRKIGLVHSTGFNDEFLACFFQGLSDKGWQDPSYAYAAGKRPISHNPPTSASAKYGPGVGHKGVRDAIKAHGNVHLIVAAGGLVSQASAYEELYYKAIPFVYLSGRIPATAASADGKYCGVVLNTTAQYPAAARGLGVDPAGVWLVQNSNSEMAKAEFDEWPGIVGNSNRFSLFRPAQPNAPPQPNDVGQYPQEVAKLKALNPKGLVVSSDPFFRSTASQLKAALATLSVPVCYPFNEFSPSGQDILLPGGAPLSSVFPSDPANAFYQLGDRAGAVLDAATAAKPVPSTKIPSRIWNGSTWDYL